MSAHEAKPVNGYGTLPKPVRCTECGQPIIQVSSDGDRWNWIHDTRRDLAIKFANDATIEHLSETLNGLHGMEVTIEHKSHNEHTFGKVLGVQDGALVLEIGDGFLDRSSRLSDIAAVVIQ